MLEKNFRQAEIVLTKAEKHGIKECEFFTNHSDGIEANTRLGKLEGLNSSEESNYAIRVIKDKKKAYISFSHFDEDLIDKKLETVLDLANASLPDEYNALPDPKLFAKDILDLKMFDNSEISAQTLIDNALEMEEIGLSQVKIENSEGASSSKSRYHRFYANSAGFANGFSTTSFLKVISLIAGKGLEMQVDYDGFDARHYNLLKTNKELALSAAERVILKLNPQKIQSQKIDVMLDWRVSSSLLRHLLHLVSGDAVSVGASVLKEKMNQQIFSENINIFDDPSIIYARRSMPFDGEGVRVYKKNIIENGVLKTWLLDSYNGRKLGLDSTGNCGLSGGISCWNIYMENGTVSTNELKSGKKMMLVTDIFGPNVNYLTGDFSAGFCGEYYENGKLITPVNEMTFAGNLLDMFKSLVPANDLKLDSGVDSPSLFIPGLTIAGV